jgi:hypothetical protein
MFDTVKVRCVCIKSAEDREGDVLSYLVRAWCVDFADVVLGNGVEGKLASLTITDYSCEVTFDTQESTSRPGIV